MMTEAEGARQFETLGTPETLGVAAQLLILDPGSQYTKLIDRRVRELGVKCDIAPLNAPTELIQKYRAVIIAGGPASVNADDARAANTNVFDLGIPVLGDCYGMQLAALHFGGTVGPHTRREDGRTRVKVDRSSKLFAGLQDDEQIVVMSHGDSVLELPEGFTATAMSGDIIAAMEDPLRKIYGTQFHPEVTHTKNGRDMLAAFMYEVSGLENNYTVDSKLEEAISTVKKDVGDRNVVCFVSGGLDSSVTAATLLAADLKGEIKFVLVDNGMLREGEVEQVVASYLKMGIKVEVKSEAERFRKASTMLRNGKQSLPLDEAVDPQEIRQIIGDTFIDVRDSYIEEIGWDPDNTVLAMGTLRPDLIESGSAIASTNTDEEGIKIHHNDTEKVRIAREKGLVTEPLSGLHKDEVRAIGIELGIVPEEILYRQPSPGPGGGVRIMTQDKEYRHRDLEEANAALDQYRSQGLGALILGTETVGVQGDRRSYSHLLALTTDGSVKDWKMLGELANEIPRVIHCINRVVHTSGPIMNGFSPDFTELHLDEKALTLWRRIDAVGRAILKNYGMDDTRMISQVPIVLSGMNYGEPGMYSAGVRPFLTEDFMTGEAALAGIDFPEEAYEELVSGLLAVSGIVRVEFDITDKPGATTERR